METGRLLVLLGIILAVVSIFVAGYPLLAIAVILIGLARFA